MSTKLFYGAPFGTQTARFDVAGVHPHKKLIGTFTQVPYCQKSTNELQRKLAPGLYDVDSGSFSERSLSEKASGPGWKEAREMERNSKLPHVLYRREWAKKRELVRRLGPGKYNVERYDFLHALKSKPTSTRGVCMTKEKRFRHDYPREVFPGPGTYGIPTRALEEKATKSASNVGMLDAGAKLDRSLPTVGCHLAPGRYNIQSDADKIYNRIVSKKGPFDVFSEDRSQVKTGHYAIFAPHKLSPGEYDLPEFLDEMKSENKRKHGKFGTVTQYPYPPVERIFFTTLSQNPRNVGQPAPNQYDLDAETITPVQIKPPFLSSAERFDRRSNKFFTGNTNPIGPGRYNVEKWQGAQHRRACCHHFKTSSKRFFSSKFESFMKERLRSKDLERAQKSFAGYDAPPSDRKSPYCFTKRGAAYAKGRNSLQCSQLLL